MHINHSFLQALAKQISEAIMYTENRSYVRRATDVLTEALIDVLYSKTHGDAVRKESAVGLGRVGFVLTEQNDIDRFLTLWWDNYNKCKRTAVQVNLVKALSVFLEMNPKGLKEDKIKELMDDVQVRKTPLVSSK